MWGPYWGPTGSGIYEADIVWEEDALQQKGDRDAAGSQGQAASQRLGGPLVQHTASQGTRLEKFHDLTRLPIAKMRMQGELAWRQAATN